MILLTFCSKKLINEEGNASDGRISRRMRLIKEGGHSGVNKRVFEALGGLQASMVEIESTVCRLQ